MVTRLLATSMATECENRSGTLSIKAHAAKSLLEGPVTDEVPASLLRLHHNVLLYLDDGDVPPLIETGNVYTNSSFDFVGIENGSTTHIAYYDTNISLPNTEDDFEDDYDESMEENAFFIGGAFGFGYEEGRRERKRKKQKGFSDDSE